MTLLCLGGGLQGAHPASHAFLTLKGSADIYIYIYILDVPMGAKGPIFTRSIRSFRSFRWGGHSDHSAGGLTQIIQLGDHSDHSAGGITHIEYKTPVLNPSALSAKAFNPQS